MKVTNEDFDKLDGFAPKSIYTFITRKVIVETRDNPKCVLNKYDTIEFYRAKTGHKITYLWNGFFFKKVGIEIES